MPQPRSYAEVVVGAARQAWGGIQTRIQSLNARARNSLTEPAQAIPSDTETYHTPTGAGNSITTTQCAYLQPTIREHNLQRAENGRTWEETVQIQTELTQHRDQVDEPHTIIQQRRAGNHARIDGINKLTWWGDWIRPKGNATRFLFQNINGISRRSGYAEAHEIGDRAQTLEVDILALAETNTDWQHRQCGHDCTSVFRKFWNDSNINKSASAERFGTAYQPGGTLTVVGDPWAGRCKEKRSDDKLGRWNEILLQGRRGRALLIITAYSPVKNHISRAGPFTAYAQQWHLLNRAGVENPDPCKQMFIDLEKRVTAAREKGQGVIVMIDANASLQHFNNGFTNWVRRSDLVDAHVFRHSNTGEPATHARGSTRIDYILISTDVVQHLTAAGILPLFEFHHSDHRALYVDIELDTYLRGRPHHLHKFGKKGLVSTDPRAVAKYRKELLQFLQDSNIIERVKALAAAILIDGFTEEHATTLERLESEFTQARLQAASKCNNIRSLPWSPALKMAQAIHQFWKLWLSEKKLGYPLADARARTWAAGHAVFSAPTRKTIQEELKKAQKQLYDVGLNATVLRQQHLERRAEMMVVEGRMDKAKAIRTMVRVEEMRAINLKLGRVFKKNKKSGLTHLLIEDEHGVSKVVDDPDEVHQILIDRNKRHFSQAEGTPFTREPLTTLFGPYGTNKASNDLLDGTLDTAHLDIPAAAHSILSKLRRLIPRGVVSCHIHSEDMRAGKKAWRETTSVSPSGLHLGHDKAVLRLEKKAGDGEDTRLSDQVFWLQAEFINLALQNSHVLRSTTTLENYCHSHH